LDVLTRDEIERLEDAAPTERDKLIIRLLADTGIRVGELCGLRPEDIVRSQDRRTFLKVRGKGSKERLVPLAPPLVRRLDRLMRGWGLTWIGLIEHVYSQLTATDAHDAVIKLLVTEWVAGRPQRAPLAVPSRCGLA